MAVDQSLREPFSFWVRGYHRKDPFIPITIVFCGDPRSLSRVWGVRQQFWVQNSEL
jgi:hypothetical protein